MLLFLYFIEFEVIYMYILLNHITVFVYIVLSSFTYTLIFNIEVTA